MKPLIALLLICFVKPVIGQDTTYFDLKWNKALSSNAEYFRVEKKEGSKCLRVDYFAKNKQVQMKGTYLSLTPEIQDGYFEWFYVDGKLKHKGNYFKGKLEGQHLWYSANGNLESEENYLNGKLNGPYMEYYPNGKLQDKSTFVNGEQSGWTIYYRQDGSKQSEGNFKGKNRDGIWKYYDENGKVLGIDTVKIDYEFPGANMYMQLPNDNWFLFNKDRAVKDWYYIFKRNPITDEEGRSIIPAIMVKYANAIEFNGSIKAFSDEMSTSFLQRGMQIDKVLLPTNNNYPIKFKNSRLIKAHYTEGGVGHILYLLFIINKKDVGIGVFMDMTQSLTTKYESEFLDAINTIKEIN
jgi:antitoxin component YwqK of YwqJK toxin-antitoxin module